MRSRHTMDFTTGPIAKKILLFALPLVCTNILQHLYSAADSAVVGRFAGKVALAAVGSTTVITALVTNLLIGLATGANIINANLLGAGDHVRLRRSMHTGICVGALCGIILATFGIAISKPFLKLLNCPDNVIDLATTYLRIIFSGTPGSIVYNFGAGILRTHGDSKRPLLIISISGAVNVILNLIFVILFKLSVVGVALATIISNYLSAFCVMRIVFDPKGDFKLSIKELRIHRAECLNIFRVGIPCSLNAIMFNISTTLVTANVNSFGDTAIAASSAATNVSAIQNQVISGFASATISFSGQCYGAGKYKRIDRVALISSGLTVLIISLFSTVITLSPQFFIGIFNTDPGVIEVGSQKLVLMAWSFVLYGASDMYLACLRGMKKNVLPTMFNIFNVCIVRILWVLFVFPLNPTYIFLHWCFPVSYFCDSITLIGYYLYCRKKYLVPQKQA